MGKKRIRKQSRVVVTVEFSLPLGKGHVEICRRIATLVKGLVSLKDIKLVEMTKKVEKRRT